MQEDQIQTRLVEIAPLGDHVLQELREKRQISQVALAERLGVKQPTVSKIERREDVNLSAVLEERRQHEANVEEAGAVVGSYANDATVPGVVLPW